jgi:hypothetical protein
MSKNTPPPGGRRDKTPKANPQAQAPKTVTTAEITIVGPKPPESFVKAAMLAIPEFFLASLPGYCGPRYPPIASASLVSDLSDNKGILAASLEHAIFTLIEAGHLEAKRMPNRYDKSGFRPCRIVFPGSLLLYARESLWEWWRNANAGKSPTGAGDGASLPAPASPGAVSTVGVLILAALLSHFPILRTIEMLCSDLKSQWSDGTIKTELKALIVAGLVARPNGARKGATLTAAGKALAEKLAAPQ